jgi:hypothetical protein
VIEDSPSLKNEIRAAVAAGMKRASRKAIRDLEKYWDLEPAILARIHGAAYTSEQILGDWSPPESVG